MNIPTLLKMTDEQFVVWASKQLVPEPWKHGSYWNGSRMLQECPKCKKDLPFASEPAFASFPPCSVPDPITLDKNTAGELQGKCEMNAYLEAMMAVYDADTRSWCFNKWLLFYAQPRHYFIATVLCLGE